MEKIDWNHIPPEFEKKLRIASKLSKERNLNNDNNLVAICFILLAIASVYILSRQK